MLGLLGVGGFVHGLQHGLIRSDRQPLHREHARIGCSVAFTVVAEWAEAPADSDKGVALVPDRVAIRIERNQLDHARLLGRGLAHHLDDRGVDAVLDPRRGGQG